MSIPPKELTDFVRRAFVPTDSCFGDLLEKIFLVKGKLHVPVEGSFHVTWGMPVESRDDKQDALMAAVRAVARGE